MFEFGTSGYLADLAPIQQCEQSIFGDLELRAGNQVQEDFLRKIFAG